jgi:hypothetical protein
LQSTFPQRYCPAPLVEYWLGLLLAILMVHMAWKDGG